MPDTINGIQYGLEAVGYRVENSDGTYGPEKVIDWPINLTLDFQSQLLKLYKSPPLKWLQFLRLLKLFQMVL